MAENIVESIIVKLGLDGSQYNSGADKAIGKNKALNKSVGDTDKVVGTVTKTLGRWFSAIAAATAITKLVDQVQQLNDELYHLERNLGMSSSTIKNWQGAASAMGGSAEGITGSIKSLTMGMNDFKTMGDTTLLPFMNSLGVSMVDARGELRKTDDVMLDLADSFSKMDRTQAFSIASKMGIDEGTFNTLAQGRQEMEKMIAYQDTMYKSSEAELQASRDLAKNRALIGSQWESLKTMMANAVIPAFVKLSEVALGVFEYLQKHQRAVQAVFTGLAFVIGVVLTPILVKATLAALAFIAPFAPFILVVGALGAAFGLLYDDYKTWAEGGKSLFDWGAFRKYIDDSTLSTDNLKNAFKNLSAELINNAMPTLRGYAEVIQKLLSGDFKGAGSQAWNMIKNYGSNVAGVIDDLTGQEKGTLENKVSGIAGGSNTASIPNSGSFKDALKNAMGRYGINKNKNEAASFLANVEHETGDGRVLSEDTRYSYKGWKSLAKNQRNIRNWLSNNNESDFAKLSAQDKMNIMYKGMNGNTKADDGYRFRGRGGIQLTGRSIYQDYANYSGRQDIMQNPDLIATDKNLAADSAAWYWSKYNKRASSKARSGDFAGARRAVNGGNIGMDDYTKRVNEYLRNPSSLNVQQSMRQSDTVNLAGVHANRPTADRANNVQVTVDKVDINTSSSTMSGTGQDMANGLQNSFMSLRPSMN